MEYSEVPQLIDFFRCEVPLRQEPTQEYQPWSPSPYQLNGAIADEELEPEHPSGFLVDFFKTGDGDHHGVGADHHCGVDADHHCGVDAALRSRCLSAGEEKHPMAKGGGESAGVVVEQWSRPGALNLLSPAPTSTGTEESGTVAPKTPTFEMEIAYYRRPDELDSTHEGSSGFHVAESGKVLQKDHHHHEQKQEHGQKQLKRVIPASIAPPSIRSEPLDQTPTSCFRDVCTPATQFPAGPSRPALQYDDEELVQAATSLLSLASNGRLTPSDEILLRRSMSMTNENLRRWPSSEVEADEACSSVLSRPSNKRRYKLMVDLLVECPRVQRRKAVVT